MEFLSQPRVGLVAPKRADQPRDYLSAPPLLRAKELLVCQHDQFGAIPLRSGGAIPPPPKRGISARLAQYHMKTRQNGCNTPSAMLSRKGIARYGGGYLALGC